MNSPTEPRTRYRAIVAWALTLFGFVVPCVAQEPAPDGNREVSPVVSIRLGRRPVVERRVGPASVVEVHPPADAAREFGWCARPTVRPGRTVHDDRDHGDGSDTRPRGRRTNGSLTEPPVRDWPYWREWFDGSADRHMNPGPLDGTDPGPGTSSPRASSQTDRSTPMAIRPWSSMRRATRPSYPVVRRRGRGTRPPGRSCDGRDAAGARGPLSHDPDVVLAGQRSRGQGWDRVIGAVSSHLRAARASLLRNAPSRSRHRRRLVGRAAGLTPLYVKTVVQAAKSAAWRAR